MDGYYDVVYLIEGRPELAQHLQGHLEPEFAEFLLKPPGHHIHEKDEPAWSEADRLLKVKLLFLNDLSGQPPFMNRGQFDHDHFAAIFGASQICEATFDRWWTIRRIEAKRDLGHLEGPLAFTDEASVPTTRNPRVNHWLADLRLRVKMPSIIGSVVFHMPNELQISPAVYGSWERPILEILTEAHAAGGFGNDVYDACAEFVAWCLSKSPRPASVGVLSIPGAPWHNMEIDRFEWYDQVMADIAKWQTPTYLVDLGAFVITYGDEVVWPPNKRGAVLRKDHRTTRPGSIFPWAWYAPRLSSGRAGGVCPYESLPPILTPLDGTFRWLQSAKDGERMMGHEEAIEANLARLLAENLRGLPPEFVELFKSPALWRKIRSCTDCYFNLDPASTEIPGGLGRLVRFCSDSQGCIYWHIHILPCGTKHTVVATYHFTGSEHAHLHGGKPHPRDITTCAGSFEEFLYRFWIENELWYALNCGGPMPQYGEEYLAHFRSID